MTRPTVEHKGMDIYWSDNEDKWSCSEMGFSSQSLLAVKRKIDAFRKKERSGIAIPALYVSEYGTKATPCEIVEYLGEHKTYGSGRPLAPKVAVMRPGYSGERKTRNTDWLHELAPATPEVEALIAKMAGLNEEIERLKREVVTLGKQVPRLRIEDIAELVKHKLQDAEEDAE
jgi:hypothetical protein